MCTLCERFPALHPFTIRKERFRIVVSIFKDAKRDADRNSLKNANGGTRPPDGSFIMNGTLYKPAQNDDWF